MASIRFRSNKWQARVSRREQGASRLSGTKVLIKIPIKLKKTTFGELIERYLREVTPLMRGARKTPSVLKLFSKNQLLR